VAAFWLIFTGGHTTTSGAGMAFPDWPLSNGSLNPDGWLTNFFMFLEHGHRLTAGLVATMVAVLFGWVLVQRHALPRAAFWLALWALVGVLAQAVLGGLRVILDPQGIAATTSAIATTFRVLHGCCAQIELALVVSLAAVLSPVWPRLAAQPNFRKIARLAWITVALIFLQLVAGASMRHLGAGLAIPTFPLTPDGGVMPKMHNAYVDLNFTHTRFGALIVTACVVWLAVRALRLGAGEVRLTRPAVLLLALVAVQVTLGAFVIWHIRPPMLTTLHVVNGAAVLATAVLLAVRASHGAATNEVPEPASAAHLTEATA
jgi:heme a synthase